MDDHTVVRLTDDVAMPMMGLGTWQASGRECYQAVRHALRVGYRHIDTATMYQNESDIGRALRDSGVARPRVFLTTKLPAGHAGRERRTLTTSLRALGTDYVDLWLIHWPPAGRAGVEVWRRLCQAREQGLARAVGVSNYPVGMIDELVAATGQVPAVNQIPWSPPRHDPRMLAEHRTRGVIVQGYSPLRGTPLDHPVLADIASARAMSPAQVVLRWHVEHAVPVIPKSVTARRITSNFEVCGLGLSPAEVARIDAIAAG